METKTKQPSFSHKYSKWKPTRMVEMSMVIWRHGFKLALMYKGSCYSICTFDIAIFEMKNSWGGRNDRRIAIVKVYPRPNTFSNCFNQFHSMSVQICVKEIRHDRARNFISHGQQWIHNSSFSLLNYCTYFGISIFLPCEKKYKWICI